MNSVVIIQLTTPTNTTVSSMSSVDPIVISDDDQEDAIVISDDDLVLREEVEAMREFLRTKYSGYEEKSEIERLMKGTGFDCLADLGDGYDSAVNKLTILLWMNGVTDDYWSYVVEDAMSRPHTLEEIARLLENRDVPIDAFILEEFITMRLLEAPVPALTEYKQGFLTRFRTGFPPMWHRYVMTSDTEIIFGNNLPSYWVRVREDPRRYY